MSRGISRIQGVILKKIQERGSLNIMDVCLLFNYLKAEKINHPVSPENPMSWRLEFGELAAHQKHIQSIYRMMRSLENRGLVARLLHRRPAVWWGVTWKHGELRLLTSPNRNWFHFNIVKNRDGRVIFRSKRETWVLHYPEPTYSQLRHQERQTSWELMRSINSEIRKRKKLESKDS